MSGVHDDEGGRGAGALGALARTVLAADLDDALPAVLDAIRAACRAPRAAILGFDPSGTVLVLRAAAGLDARPGAHVPAAGLEAAGVGTAPPATLAALGAGECATVARAPVVTSGGAWGVLVALAPTRDALARDAAAALDDVAALVAAAVERAELRVRLWLTEQALRASEERCELIARASSDAVWDWDVVQNELRWSAASREMFRLDRPPGATIEWWDACVHPDDRARVGEKFSAAIAPGGGHDWSDEYRFLRGDGTYAAIADRGYIVRAEDGRAVRAVGSMVDVTERRELERQLVKAERLASVGTLAAGVAHEINNPLAYLMVNIAQVTTDVARAREAAADPALAERMLDWERALEEARDGADRVRRIVRDLRVFARGDEDKRGTIDVRDVMDSAVNMAFNEIRHRARLVRAYGDVPRVDASESRLAQVFLNLLVNAAQAIEPGAAEANEVVAATSTDAAGRAVIEVRDTGAGIAPDVIGRVFEPFFTTKAVGVGTGLGLSICHGIVTALGGAITVESEVGRGSTFRVVLPAAGTSARPARDYAATSRPPSTPPQAMPSSASARRARVMVIDDERALARAVGRTLAADYDVVVTESARDALARVQAGETYDVILCDVMMPDVTGIDLYDELARARPELARRVVFMTGGAFTPHAQDFLARVPNARIEKPFTEQGLLACVAEAARRT